MRKIATAQHWVDKNCWNFCMSLPFVCRICWSKKISWKFVFSKCPNFCRSIVTLEMAIDFFLIYYFKICIIQGFQKCIIHICPMLLRLVLIHQQGVHTFTLTIKLFGHFADVTKDAFIILSVYPFLIEKSIFFKWVSKHLYITSYLTHMLVNGHSML